MDARNCRSRYVAVRRHAIDRAFRPGSASERLGCHVVNLTIDDNNSCWLYRAADAGLHNLRDHTRFLSRCSFVGTGEPQFESRRDAIFSSASISSGRTSGGGLRMDRDRPITTSQRWPAAPARRRSWKDDYPLQLCKGQDKHDVRGGLLDPWNI